MNEAEKERLIKKDIKSIENRVRSAFNQGYEMGLKESRSEIPNTCGDAISREEAIMVCLNGWNKRYDEILEDIRNLPSVSPQPKAGRWIKQNYGWNWQCSECGFVTPSSAKEIFTFCPNCGAKMELLNGAARDII